jgi:hypothetical protein
MLLLMFLQKKCRELDLINHAGYPSMPCFVTFGYAAAAHDDDDLVPSLGMVDHRSSEVCDITQLVVPFLTWHRLTGLSPTFTTGASSFWWRCRTGWPGLGRQSVTSMAPL